MNLKILVLALLIITVFVSCNSENIKGKENQLACEEGFYEKIDYNSVIDYKQGFSYSYSYNLDSTCEITFELLLIKGNKVIEKITIKDIKRDVGDIDGTFGVSARTEIDNNTIVFSLRHDELSKNIDSPNFFMNMKGYDSSIASGGKINSGGSFFTFDEHIPDVGSDGEERESWSIKVKISGVEVEEIVE